MCHVLDIHPSGYYAWVQHPDCHQERRRKYLLGRIKQFWLESGGVYGYRKIYSDLRDDGESCGINLVHRLMKQEGLTSQRGYRKPRSRGGSENIVAANKLARAFNPTEPNKSLVTDITYIKTHEGWLYLAVVIDLFSRRVIGWSMKSRITKELALDALLMAIWRRSPIDKILVHSDQGSQYTSHDWDNFLSQHDLEASMRRKDNCHDNAVAESCFQLLKRECIKRKTYSTREEARVDIFEYIEMFYNVKRRHSSNDQMSPVEYEKQYKEKLKSV
ncbi:transposase [Veronia pacifica]|uniref:Transposase n=2 Tax=Veronia pacifica TaxID=1080227 RepID=A0A1C3EIM4_9GAMM|nr:transposase [Veronia pacifica]